MPDNQKLNKYLPSTIKLVGRVPQFTKNQILHFTSIHKFVKCIVSVS